MPTPQDAQDAKDYQDYQDYHAYQQYQAQSKNAGDTELNAKLDGFNRQLSNLPESVRLGTAADAIDPNAQSGPGNEVSGVEKALRTGESLANGYSAGVTKPAFALAGAAGDALHSYLTGNDPDKSVFDAPDKTQAQRLGDKVQYQTDRQKQFESENPVTSTVANVAGAVAPGSVAGRIMGGVGKAIGVGSKAATPAYSQGARLAQWLGSTAKDAVAGAAAGAGTEGLSGAANALTDKDASLSQTGRDMERGAVFGAAIPTALNVAKPVLQKGGQLISRMMPKSAQTLVDDAPRVDDIYGKMKGPNSNPQALDEQMGQAARDASDKLSGKDLPDGAQSVQERLMGQYKQGLTGKNISVPSSTMADTGIPNVDSELQRVKSLQPQKPGHVQVRLEDQLPQTPDAQYMDRMQRMQSARQGSGPSPVGPNQAARRGAVESGMGGAEPTAADGSPAAPGQQYGYDSSKIPPYSPEGASNPLQYDPSVSGRVNTAKNVPATPRNPNVGKTQDIPYTRPEPSSYSLTGEQAHNLAQTAQGNTSFSDKGLYGTTAVGNAKGLGMALKEGLHAVGGEGAGSLADLDSQMSQNAKLGRVFRKMTGTDPTAGIGTPSVSKQAVLQKMDKATGSDLYGLGKAASAAKDFKPGLTPAAGRQTLRALGWAQRNELGDKSLKAILGLMNNKSGEE